MIKKLNKTIQDLDEGSLFLYGTTTALDLVLKTKYKNMNTACLCYIVGSGKVFHGGTDNDADLNNLIVTPVVIKELINEIK